MCSRSFKLVKCAIHGAHMHSQKTGDAALPNLYCGALEYVARQHAVDTPRRHRQPVVEQHRVRNAGVLLCAAVFGFCERKSLSYTARFTRWRHREQSQFFRQRFNR
jgi:hypothetical protein